MSLEWFWKGGGVSGGDHLIEGGYIELVDVLADALDIETNAAVESITVEEGGVIVETTAGTREGSHVIVTVPLGVLKAGHIAFDPPLPESKLGAIDRLDMGNMEKVVLVFDDPWWEDDGPMYFVSELEDGAWALVADMSTTAGAPTLVVFTGGTFSREVRASMTDEEVLDDAMAAMERGYGRSIPTPVATHVTQWTNDPFALGSYSYLPVGSSRDDIDELAEPVGERLMFAGEATYWLYYQTVHGALLSGLREAERLGVNRVLVPGLEDWTQSTERRASTPSDSRPRSPSTAARGPAGRVGPSIRRR